MKYTVYFSILLGVSCVITHQAHAGAALDQRLKAAQQQRAAYQQAQQQALLQQRQAQQRAVYQQQVQQRQVQIMQEQMARQRQVAVAQQQIIKQQIKQNAINQQQAIYSQSQQYQQKLYQQQLQTRPQQLAYAPTQHIPQTVYEPHVEDVVDMATIWKDFEISSEAWPLIIDMESKEIIVAKFIEDYRAKGTVIDKKPMHYVQLIDAMSFDNPDILSNSFDKILQIVAIIEYDFDNGSNPDAMAKQILGDKGYQQNKKRLGR